MVQKTVSTSADGRARVEIGSQVDFSYLLDSGASSVVSLPLTALPTLDELVSVLSADADVQAMILVPEPDPEPEEPVVPPEEVTP